MANKENALMDFDVSTLKEIDVSTLMGFDVSTVTDMRSMFRNTPNFNKPLVNWDTSKANNDHNEFDGSGIGEVNKPIDTVKPPRTKIVNNLADLDKLFQPSKKKGKLHSKLFKWVRNLVKSRT